MRQIPATLPFALAAFPASAQTMFEQMAQSVAGMRQHEFVTLAILIGILVFAATTAIILVRTRTTNQQKLAAAQAEIALLRDEAERAISLMLAEPQVLVVWRDHNTDPEIIGDAAALTGAQATRRLLAFGTWLEPAPARALEQAVDRLRRRGEGFSMTLATARARHIEAEGRPIGGAAVLRLRDITGTKLELATLAERHERMERDFAELRELLDAAPTPIWLRDDEGKIAFANRAYARAVEAADPADAVSRGLELLDSTARGEAATLRGGGETFHKRVPAVVAGERRVLDVFELGRGTGSAGIGIDATEAERMRSELKRAIDAHRRTLDQLATAVVMFGPDEKLVFCNDAYAKLFDLDPSFLDEHPTDSAILDRLRAERKLPEQADFRAWKSQLHEAYRSPEARENWWHLPGGRTLRVVTTANPEGGVTYIYDDISERIELESRYNALIHAQRETLDALAEAVALFGSDGRLKLFNRSFAELWELPAKDLAEHPHVEKVGAWCRTAMRDGAATWHALQLAVTGMGARHPLERRVAFTDGREFDCAAVPLPDGGTLVTFRDVSATAQVERALKERNEALEAADSLKNAFVGHVSYELRSPLTNIIGFAELLKEPMTGALNEKQREYIAHINDSSVTLLALINDILDLATIDAGAMHLDLGEVDIRAAVESAVEGVRDRLRERGVRLSVRLPKDAGRFVADDKRVRQVLFNLLSNAAGFSPQGETVTLTVERARDAVIFKIADRGPGIPAELQERIFGRFESHTLGSQHRGAGLGLSIVRSLMELHGGRIAIDSEPGKGTLVTCVFPTHAAAGTQAAE
jgi:signal transduction histidine kinase